MTKTEQTRLQAWRFKVLQQAADGPRNVARTCRLSRFGTHSSRRRRMSHELLHVFKHSQRQRLFHGRKVVEEFRERSAMFQVIEQRPNRHARSNEG